METAPTPHVMTQLINIMATGFFGLAIVHTFLVKRFQHIARSYPEGSVGENFFHLLGEVEVVFGFWAMLFLGFLAFDQGTEVAIRFLESQNFTEPAFVFVIMAIAATRPIRLLTFTLLENISRLIGRILPLGGELSFFLVLLFVGPLLGSFVTEPAAMTVCALALRERFFQKKVSDRFLYTALAVLFVNISIGGVLTHFAAPPVVMVAKTWNWGLGFMFTHFGWKAMIAVAVNTVGAAWLLRNDLRKLDTLKANLEVEKTLAAEKATPVWVTIIHALFLAAVVWAAHHMVVFAGMFLLFIGVAAVTAEYQEELQLKESLLVGFFLGGLVILGSLQSWWLAPLLVRLAELPLFMGAAGLTAITDNAALTFLGSQVEGLSDALKYALVSGAVAGGGLTVIANAPNPIGFGILKECFGPEGISPLTLLRFALLPTAVAMLCFWFL